MIIAIAAGITQSGCANTASVSSDVGQELQYASVVATQWDPPNQDFLKKVSLIQFSINQPEQALATLKGVTEWYRRFMTLWRASDPGQYGIESAQFALKHATQELRNAQKRGERTSQSEDAESNLAVARVRLGASLADIRDLKTRYDGPIEVFKAFLGRGDIKSALEHAGLNPTIQRPAAGLLAEAGQTDATVTIARALSAEDRDAILVRLIDAIVVTDYQRCEELLKTLETSDTRSDAYRILAKARWTRGDKAVAEEYLRRSETELAKAASGPVDRGLTLPEHVELWSLWGHPTESERCIRAVRKACEELKGTEDEHYVDWILYRLAETAARTGDVTAARRQAAMLGRHFKSVTLFHISTELVQRGEISHIEDILKEMTSEFDRAEILTLLAERHLDEDKGEEARLEADRALTHLAEERRLEVKAREEPSEFFRTSSSPKTRPSIMELAARAAVVLASKDGIVRLSDLARAKDPEFDDGFLDSAYSAGEEAAKRGYRVDSVTLELTSPRTEEEAYLRLGYLAGLAGKKKSGR